MINPNFVFIGVLLNFIGGISYIIDTIKGKVQPNRVSWLLWSFAPLIAFIGQIQQGVGIRALSTFIVGFVPLLVFLSSFLNKKSVWKIEKLDIICGVLSAIGLTLFLITKEGNIAIIFGIMADLLAGIPTIVKSYHHPDSENAWPYFTGVINPGIVLLTITLWNFEYFGFPIYLITFNSIVTLLVWSKIGKKFKIQDSHERE